MEYKKPEIEELKLLDPRLLVYTSGDEPDPWDEDQEEYHGDVEVPWGGNSDF